MPEVRRRRVAPTGTAVTRRRDRVEPEVEEEDDELEDVDATQRPARKASAKKSTTKRRVVERHNYDEDEDEDEDPEEDETDDVEDEDEEPEERPRRRTASKSKSKSSTRTRSKLPPGVTTGLAGAEIIRKAASGGPPILTLGKDPKLIKVLEPEQFVNYRQHWIGQGSGQADKPYFCIGQDCPLCGLGDYAGASHCYNVLDLSVDGDPVVNVLRLGVKANRAFEDLATPKNKDKPVFERDFWVITRSGQKQQSQTNFRQIKLEDIEEDWQEIFEHFDIDDLDDIIEEAKEKCFGWEVMYQPTTKKQLDEVARYLLED